MKGADVVTIRPRKVRIAVLGIALLGAASTVIGRAVFLHMSASADLSWVAQKQYQAVVPMTRQRGKILDARGQELAVSVPMQSIFVDPSSVVDPDGTVAAIEQIIRLSDAHSSVVRRVRQGKRFAWIERKVPPDLALRVKQLKLPGVNFVEEMLRIYPNRKLASQLLGAVGVDGEPLGGLELAYNVQLAGDERFMVYQRDARGRFFVTPVNYDPTKTPDALKENGETKSSIDSVVLTIDKVVQYITDQALERAARAAEAKGAVAIVIETQTGRILAMSSWPNFDPNEYSDFPHEAWRNRAIADAYEPGSTFKTLIVAAALDVGMKISQKFDCQKGILQIANAVMHDSHPHGVLDVAEIIKVSSNIGAAKIAMQLGKERVDTALRAFGVGAKTGVNFPGEVGGTLRAAKSWSPVEFATVAFGQGVTATPLQMVMAYAALANGGVLMRPYIVDHVQNVNGETIYTQSPQTVRQVVSASTASTMRSLLAHVVEIGGTGTAAASDKYPTGGKTGTAQKVEPGHKGYAANKFYSSFIGMAPIDAPKLAVYVALDEPRGAYYGGAVAAPVFKEIVEGALQYLSVPASDMPVVITGAAPNVNASAITTALIAEKDAQGAAPQGANIVKLSTDVAEFRVQDAVHVVMPNLAGLSLREVVRMAHDAAINVHVKGQGMVVAQRPQAGSVVERGRAIDVECALPQ